MNRVTENIKHIIRIILKRRNYSYPFFKMENKIHPQTIINRPKVINWAEQALVHKSNFEDESQYLNSGDQLLIEGYKLKKNCLSKYYLKHQMETDIRLMIHVPTVKETIAGHSLFSNLSEALQYLGIKVMNYYSGGDLSSIANVFKPSIFITSDNAAYVNSIDWDNLKKYSANNKLKIGFTASLEEYGNTPLTGRLEKAKKLDISFYYSFRAKEYISGSDKYNPFREAARGIFCVEYGANPLIYYPLPNIKRDINYVFLGSSNDKKRERYVSYYERILTQYAGFLDGPGWYPFSDFNYNRHRDRYIYARGKVGLNLHLENQIMSAGELNERTYILAMCGIPQIIDNPLLLNRRFSKGAMIIAESQSEYYEGFKELLNNPEEGRKMALIAQREVFEKHTTLHRADQFVNDLKTLF